MRDSMSSGDCMSGSCVVGDGSPAPRVRESDMETGQEGMDVSPVDVRAAGEPEM